MNILETDRGIRLEVRVVPRSSRDEIAGEMQGALKVKLAAPPVEGEANKALISFLADLAGVPRKNVAVVRGETSRNKLVEIAGVTRSDFLKRIAAGTADG